MTFEGIRKQALVEWETLQKSDKPRILIGAGTCGRAAGALDILEAINKELAQHNIEAILIQVGCLGPCFADPMIGIIKTGRSQVIYANLTIENSSRIIKDYLIHDNPRSDLP